MTEAPSKALTFTRSVSEFTECFERTQEIRDLGNLLRLSGWDQWVKMPLQANHDLFGPSAKFTTLTGETELRTLANPVLVKRRRQG